MTPEQQQRWQRRAVRVPPDNQEAVAWELGVPAYAVVSEMDGPPATRFLMRIADHDRPKYIQQELHGSTLDKAIDEAEAIVNDLGWPCPWANDPIPADPQSTRVVEAGTGVNRNLGIGMGILKWLKTKIRNLLRKPPC